VVEVTKSIIAAMYRIPGHSKGAEVDAGDGTDRRMVSAHRHSDTSCGAVCQPGHWTIKAIKIERYYQDHRIRANIEQTSAGA